MTDRRVYANADVALADETSEPAHKTVHVTVDDGYVHVAEGPQRAPRWTYPEHAVEEIVTRFAGTSDEAGPSGRSATVTFSDGISADIRAVRRLSDGWLRLVYDRLTTDGHIVADVPPAQYRAIEWHDD